MNSELTGGTGQVTLHLAQNGYINLTLGDKNKGMMDVAKKNLDKFPVKFIQTEMQTLQNVNDTFDAIVIRQAINYLMTIDGLALGFKNMYNHLKSGGSLIFNAPNYQKDDKSIETLDRELNYESGGYKVKVMEKNYMEVVTGCLITDKGEHTFAYSAVHFDKVGWNREEETL